MAVPFLRRVMLDLFERFGNHTDRYNLILPTHRSGNVALQHFSEIIDFPVNAPRLYTIDEFIRKHSGLEVPETFNLVIRLYKLYKEEGGGETLEEFYPWGQMMLNDFDEIDRYLVDPKQLFSFGKADKELQGFLPMDELPEFWDLLNKDHGSDLGKKFINYWQLYEKLYYRLREQLLNENKGWPGLAYRKIAEDFDHLAFGEKVNAFIGFNALSTAEIKLIKDLKKHNKAIVYWNADKYYINDPEAEAGYFIRKNLKEIGEDNVHLFSESLIREEKTITKVGVPLKVGVAKAAAMLLNRENVIGLTAVTLAEENLLIPFLSSLPNTDRIFISGGYPILNTPVYSLLKALLRVCDNYETGSEVFYFRHVNELLNHNFFNSESVSDLLSTIAKKNIVYVPVDLLKCNDLSTLIFSGVTKEIIPPNFIEELFTYIASTKKIPEIEVFIESAIQFKSLASEVESDINLALYIKLFLDFVKNKHLPIKKDITNNIQVSGMLETRALDFDNVFLLPVNEGVLPGSSFSSSFIPYMIRKRFGLPTFDEQEKLYAYNFFQLLHSAKNIYLIYNSDLSGKGEEKSRYLRQIEQLLAPLNDNIKIKEENYTFSLTPQYEQKITVKKDEKFYEAIWKKAENGGLSPTFIDRYFNCSLQFYLQTVLGIYPLEEVEESFEGGAFGIVFHNVMQEFYLPFEGKSVSGNDIANRKNELDQLILNAIAQHYGKSETKRLNDTIVVEALRILINKTLDFDSDHAPFEYLQSEKEWKGSIELDGKAINFKGFIDRIDRKNGITRLVDYKTGKVESYIYDYTDPEIMHEKKIKEAFQVMLYGYFYAKEHSISNLDLQILPVKEIVKGYVPVNVEKPLRDTEDFKRFEDKISQLFQEILDPDKPITQTTELQNCTYCDFVNICMR